MNRRDLFAAALTLAALPGLVRAQDERKQGGGPSYIQLDTLTANITRPNGQLGVMTVELGVDAPDAAVHALAVESMPLLRANYAEVIRTYAAGLPPGGAPDADYLSRMLQQQTDRTLGRPGARLLLGAILVN